jgi:hypothetical protein
MRRKSRDVDEQELLEMDADLASLYDSVERLKLHNNLVRAMFGTHLSQMAGIWFDVVNDRSNYEEFTDKVLTPGSMIEYAAEDEDGEPQGNAIAIIGKALKSKSGLLFRGRQVLATDSEYEQWAIVSDEDVDRVCYHFCDAGARGKCEEGPSGNFYHDFDPLSKTQRKNRALRARGEKGKGSAKGKGAAAAAQVVEGKGHGQRVPSLRPTPKKGGEGKAKS